MWVDCIHGCVAYNEGSREGWGLEKAMKQDGPGEFFDAIKRGSFLTLLRAPTRAREGERRLLTNVDIQEALYAHVREWE
jgi:hypothetical protein